MSTLYTGHVVRVLMCTVPLDRSEDDVAGAKDRPYALGLHALVL